MSRRRVAVALLGVWLAAAAPIGAQDADGGDLERLRRAIEESRARVGAFEREERGLLEALEAIERSAALLATDVQRAKRRATEARAELVRTEAEAEGVAEMLAALEKAMSKRAVALYRAGELGAVPLLFASGDLREFLSRVQALRRLLTHDGALLARHRETSRALVAAREGAALAAEESARAERTLAERAGQLREERERKRVLARRIRRSRAHERSALAELETAARALEEAVAALPPESLDEPVGTPGRAFASLRGRLALPVEGPVARDFGRVVDEEFRTATFRKGVSFDVPVGTPVTAVAAGRVRYAGRFRGYGNTVILDHGEQYFTVSAHLSELGVAVGDWVDASQEIARSGETGSLAGAQFYFEIRRGGDALDPRDWLGTRGARR